MMMVTCGTVDEMPVYYGGDFDDSDCEDPRDLVTWLMRIRWIGITLMLRKDVVLISRIRWKSDCPMLWVTVMMVGEVAQPARVRQDLLETSVPVMDIGITAPVGDIPVAGNVATITAEFKDPQNDFETVHGMHVYYGGDLNDSDYESPGDNDYDTWEDWCDSDIRYCGFSPDDEETQLPVIICSPVFRGEGMDEPLRVLPDNWDASVSVVHVNPDPVVVSLSPETVRGNDIVLHQLEEKCRTNTFAVLHLILSDVR